MNALQRRLADPFFIMGVAAILLLVKVAVKLGIGFVANSPMYMADGTHNIPDFIQQIVTIIVLYIATRPRTQEYSMGRGNAEYVATMAVAAGLMLVVVGFVRTSLGGLAQSMSWLQAGFHWAGTVISSVPHVGPWFVEWISVGQVEPSQVTGPLFWPVFVITLASIGISRLTCYYQVKVGQATGHAVVAAAGTEAGADSYIEMVTLVGIICEAVLPMYGWIEYAFALFVAAIVARTAFEMFHDSWRALMARSIGVDIDAHLRQMCLEIPGIIGVVALGTFRVGPMAVVKVTLNTMLDSAVPMLVEAVEMQLRHFVLTQGFLECQVDVMIKRPTADRHRVAYAVRCSADGEIRVVAPTIAQATHIVVADIEFEDIDRATVHVVPADIDAFLERKRVRTLYVFEPERQLEQWTPGNVALAASPSYVPAAVGLSRRA